MSLLNKKKEIVYPFSGFEGQLLYKGEPAANAKITRIYNQMEQGEIQETATTDNEGKFNFESIALEFKKPLISAVSYISHQKIFVTFNQETYQIWGGGKSSKLEFSEFGNKRPEQLTCELTDEPYVVDLEKDGIVTNCKWL